MRYENKRAFEKHLSGASPHHFAPVYLIVSKEPFELEESSELVQKYLIPPEKRSLLALCTFEGHQLQMDALLFELQSSSFFVERQVVLVKEVEKSKKAAGLDKLQTYLNRPNPTKFLLLTASSLRKDDALYKMVEKAGVILDIPDPKPWEKEKLCIEWIIQQATSIGKTLSFAAAQYLVKNLGTDQLQLKHELEKLACYADERQEITPDDINLLSARLSLDSIWQLGESILKRETAAALKMGRRIIENGELIPLIRGLRSQFQTQFQIATILAQGKGAQAISEDFPYMKEQILDRNIQTAQNYGLNFLREGILLLDAAEWQAKSSQEDPTLLVDLLITKLTQTKLMRTRG